MRYPRLFEEKGGELFTLFHGVNRSRHIPEGDWIEADMKLAYDGSNKRSYMTGFHVFRTWDAARYVERFTASRKLVIVEVQVGGHVWPKPTNPDILLCQYMFVPYRAQRVIVKEAA